MNLYDAMAITIADCPFCGAKIGHDCINTNGRLTKSTHWKRKCAVQEWRKADHEALYRKFRKEVAARLELLKTPEYGFSGC
jgi:hypothetical protein